MTEFDIDLVTFRIALEKSRTIREALIRVGLNPDVKSNQEYFKRKCVEFNVSYSSIKRRNRRQCRKIDEHDVFCIDSFASQNVVKNRFLSLHENNYTCFECGLNGFWNGKKITLQMDHINGIRTDNRLSNLRLLCPNCHSQTDTFCAKNRGKLNRHKKNKSLLHAPISKRSSQVAILLTPKKYKNLKILDPIRQHVENCILKHGFYVHDFAYGSGSFVQNYQSDLGFSKNQYKRYVKQFLERFETGKVVIDEGITVKVWGNKQAAIDFVRPVSIDFALEAG